MLNRFGAIAQTMGSAVATSAPLVLRILGPLRIRRGSTEIDEIPPQQALLLAVLLARAGRPVRTTELIGLLWADQPPATAVHVIHKHVSALRRLLEPELPARGIGSYLLGRGNGYLFAAPPGVLDLITFRELVAAAEAAEHPDVALDHYLEALGLWDGPAAGGLAATPDFAALDDEFLRACAAAAEPAVVLDRPGPLLPALRLAAGMAPRHEPVQAALMTVLTAAGQPAEALSVFRAVRTRLAEEQGVAPGPELRVAHQRVLAQAGPVTADSGLVGRVAELAVLRQAVGAGLDGGAGLVLIGGEPGAGKSRLLEEIAREARALGGQTVWGRCVEGDGTPSMWPWIQVLRTILDSIPADERKKWADGELGRLAGPHGAAGSGPARPAEAARFRLFEQAVAVLGTVAARQPLVLLIDDLQWADLASLEMFRHLAARLPHGTVVIGALRDRAPSPGAELTRTLAAAGRTPGHRRIGLTPLDRAEVAELVRRDTGREVAPDVVRVIHDRTEGNPFFVRELSRFLAGGGELTARAAARSGVPSTVRDIVRDRIEHLDDDTTHLVRVAALIGRDLDLGLLAGAAGLDVQTCLDELEPLDALGLIGPGPDDPFTFRFAHDLVREAVAEATPLQLAPALHLRVADALAELADADAVAERLAYHLWAAGPRADPARTAAALIQAGRHAAAKSALDAAKRQLESAAQVARAAGLAELELAALSQLTAVTGMRFGYRDSTFGTLERAERLARDLGREREAADFLFSRRAAHSQAVQLEQSGRLARRLLDQAEVSADPVVRAYGLHSWGIHQWDIGNVGEAYRYLSRSNQAVLGLSREDHPLRFDLQLMSAGMLAETTALHGDVGTARTLLDKLAESAGDDSYVVTVAASFTARVAALTGDPEWGLRAAERGIAVDPGFSFTFFGAYLRLARCWARALTGDDPAGAAAEAQRILTTVLLDPPRSNVPTWYGLLGEMWLAAGALTEAEAALDQADRFIEEHGQRYAEGLLLLLRAALLRARGEPAAVVREVAERARALSAGQEAYLFVRRAEDLLADLPVTPRRPR